MKKHVFVAMAAMISMAWMTGCSGGESKETAADTKAESFGTAAAAEETEKAGDGSEAEATVSAVDVDPESRLGKILASGKITMGTAPDFAPMEFKNVGAKGVEYVGSDIELGKYIAEKLGVELEIKAMEFSAIQAGTCLRHHRYGNLRNLPILRSVPRPWDFRTVTTSSLRIRAIPFWC